MAAGVSQSTANPFKAHSFATSNPEPLETAITTKSGFAFSQTSFDVVVFMPNSLAIESTFSSLLHNR